MKRDFDDLTPADRRVVLVASDERYKTLVTSIGVKKTLHFLAAGGSALFLPEFVDDAKTLAGILKRGELPWPHLPPAQASGRFSFDQGHPVDGGLYVQHRCFPDRYICPSLAESRYARQRVSALKDLACALGAKELRVLSVTSHESKGWLSADTPIPEIGAQVGLHVEAGAGDELRVSTVAEWAQPTRAPYVPDGLKHWLDQEPEFESLASGRMRGQLRKDAVSLTFGDSYGLSAKAVAAFESLKLDVGGGYQGVAHSTWSFEVEFWPS